MYEVPPQKFAQLWGSLLARLRFEVPVKVRELELSV